MVKGLRRRALVLLAVAVSLVIGTPLAVGANGRHGSNNGKHRVEFSSLAAGDPVISPLTGPNGEALPNGAEIFSISGASTISGDLVGTSYGAGYVGSAAEGAYGFAAVGAARVLTLTDSPCGTGTLVVSAAGASGMSQPISWQIAQGAGTGDLIDVRGGGTYTSSATGSEWVGTIRCS